MASLVYERENCVSDTGAYSNEFIYTFIFELSKSDQL